MDCVVDYYNINGIDYLVIKEASYNGFNYVYLANENEEDDLMVRRVNGDILEALDSEDELINVMKLFLIN